MIAAVSMVRDEADIIKQTVGHMLTQVDHVIVADNGSTDGTVEILEKLDVDLTHDPDPAYYQSAKMTALAALARDQGAEWIVPFDADEIWRARQPPVAATLRSLPPEAMIAEAALFDHVATGLDRGGRRISQMRYRRREPAPLRKVAVRAHGGLTIHQGNHSATFDGVQHPLTVTGQLEIRHFPYRSPEQFIRKVRNGAAAYAASDLPEEVGSHWRSYGRLTDEQLTEVFYKWFYREDPHEPIEIEGERQPPLVCDPCPLK